MKLTIINNVQGEKFSLYAGKVKKINNLNLSSYKMASVTIGAKAWNPLTEKEEDRDCEISFWNNSGSGKNLADRIERANVKENSFISALIVIQNRFKIFSLDDGKFVEQKKHDVFLTDGNFYNNQSSIVMYDKLPCGMYELYSYLSPNEKDFVGIFAIENEGEFPIVKRNKETGQVEVAVQKDDNWQKKKPIVVGVGVNFKYSGIWTFPEKNGHGEVNVVIGRVNKLREYDNHVSVDMAETRGDKSVWRHISFWNNEKLRMADYAKSVLQPNADGKKPYAIIVCGKNKPFTYTTNGISHTNDSYNAYRFDVIKN